MIAYFKRIMRRKTPVEVAAEDLALTELQILQWHLAQEEAAYNVELCQTRIQRLREFLAQERA